MQILLDLREKNNADLSAQSFSVTLSDKGSVTPLYTLTGTYVGTVTINGQTAYRFSFLITLTQALTLTTGAYYTLAYRKSSINGGWDETVPAILYQGS